MTGTTDESGSQNEVSSGITNITGTTQTTQPGGGLGSVIKGLAGVAGIAAPFLGGTGGLSRLFGGAAGSSAGQLANAFAGLPTMNIQGIRRPQFNMGAMW